MRHSIYFYMAGLAALLLSIPAANAASVSASDFASNGSSEAAYLKVDLFEDSVHFTDSFHIAEAGDYRAVLTDFAFPDPLADAGFNITTTNTSLGALLGPGELSFSAVPGDYFISLFAVAGRGEPAADHDLNFGQYSIEISRFSQLSDVSLDVTAVPLPAAIWLFGSGLAGLAGMGAARRQRA